MEHINPTNIDIIINITVQIINLAIFFFIFYKFLAWPIIDAVEKRKEMLNQLKNADEILEKKLKEAEEKKEMLNQIKNADEILKKKLKEAEEKKDALIEEGMTHKNKIIEEAKQEAENVKKSILVEADRERENIIKKWAQEIENIKKDLEKSWTDSVKKWIYSVYEKIVWEKDETIINKYVSKITK